MDGDDDSDDDDDDADINDSPCPGFENFLPTFQMVQVPGMDWNRMTIMVIGDEVHQRLFNFFHSQRFLPIVLFTI
jgi:hypothetical protein